MWPALTLFAVAAPLVALLVWLAHRRNLAKAAMEEELASLEETMLRGPDRASYRGAEKKYGRVKCDGWAFATPTRLVFHSAMGRRIEIPWGRVAGIEEEAWFLGAARAGLTHMILRLKDGNRIGFFVFPHDEWTRLARSHTQPEGDAA